MRSSIFGPEWPHFNPMRLLRNRVVDEWTDRLSEVPTDRDNLPVIGRTIFLGQETEMRKFKVLLPTADTEGDWRRCRGRLGKVSALSTRSGRRRMS